VQDHEPGKKEKCREVEEEFRFMFFYAKNQGKLKRERLREKWKEK
jgi:hypothetical protein